MLREKIMFIDELTPEEGITITGFGKPEAIYKKIPEILSKVLQISKRDVLEKKHERDENKIKANWEIVKFLDEYSYYHFEFSFQGTKNGNIKIHFTAKLKTELLREYLWQKSVLYEFFRTLWYEYIYTRKRKKYLEEGYEIVDYIVSHIKSLLR
ncbi:MAG TPA: hypothetical protein EYH56_01735 [Nanoarchaeota archaeon]|nr:hypothetical protein [Nanoarchaeota archaeon]